MAVLICMLTLDEGSRDRWILRVYQPAMLAKSVSPNFSERPCLKHLGGEQLKKIANVHICISTHTHTAHILSLHTHAYMHNFLVLKHLLFSIICTNYWSWQDLMEGIFSWTFIQILLLPSSSLFCSMPVSDFLSHSADGKLEPEQQA